MQFLRWLKGLFTRTTDNPYDGYKPKERMIFRYWDGEKDRDEDPMVLYVRMQDVGPELDVDLKVARSASKDNTKAHMAAVDKVRKIFGVNDYQSGGLTNIECLDLLDYFLLWTGFEKKSTRPTQTSAGATSLSSESTPEGKPPTESISGSGSAGSDTTTDSPGTSPSGSVSPSVPSTPERDSSAT